MHPGCCPTTDPPTTADSMWMAHILREAERREGVAQRREVLAKASHTAESSCVHSVQCARP